MSRDYVHQRMAELGLQVHDDRRPGKLKNPQRCCVYVFPAREYVKIGMAMNAAQRWSELRTGNPLLESAAFVSEPLRNARKVEALCHERLAGYRVPGTEWFRCNRHLAVETVRQVIAEFATVTEIRNTNCTTDWMEILEQDQSG